MHCWNNWLGEQKVFSPSQWDEVFWWQQMQIKIAASWRGTHTLHSENWAIEHFVGRMVEKMSTAEFAIDRVGKQKSARKNMNMRCGRWSADGVKEVNRPALYHDIRTETLNKERMSHRSFPGSNYGTYWNADVSTEISKVGKYGVAGVGAKRVWNILVSLERERQGLRQLFGQKGSYLNATHE